ncbi:IS481 family transposase, partial [Oceanidesulfovibrio marinus]
FRIKGREKWYESVEEMQEDLDSYLNHYNRERTHQGRGMNGRVPYQAFLDGIVTGEAEAEVIEEAA